MTGTVLSMMLSTVPGIDAACVEHPESMPRERVSRARSRPVLSCPVLSKVQSCGAFTQTGMTFRNGKHLSFCRESAVRDDAQRERAHIRVTAPPGRGGRHD